MFADDIAVYPVVCTAADYIVLQDDITAIAQWVEENYLTLDAGKCCLMFVTRKRIQARSNPFPRVPLP